MAVPTPAQIKKRVETDLDEVTLQRFIDGEKEELESRFGSMTSIVEDILGGGKLLFPQHRVSSITTVVETVGSTDTTLAIDDWRLEHDGRYLRRLDDGTNIRSLWGDRVRLTYVPTGAARKERVLHDLVYLAVQYNALASHSTGDYDEMQRQYQEERLRLLSTLESDRRMIA